MGSYEIVHATVLNNDKIGKKSQNNASQSSSVSSRRSLTPQCRSVW